MRGRSALDRGIDTCLSSRERIRRPSVDPVAGGERDRGRAARTITGRSARAALPESSCIRVTAVSVAELAVLGACQEALPLGGGEMQ